MGSRAVGPGGIWRIDAGNPRPTRTPTIRDVPTGQSYGAGSIWTSSWVAGGDATQIDATRGTVVHQWLVPNSGEGESQNLGLTYAYGYAWLVSPSGDLLDPPVMISGWSIRVPELREVCTPGRSTSRTAADTCG